MLIKNEHKVFRKKKMLLYFITDGHDKVLTWERGQYSLKTNAWLQNQDIRQSTI